MPHGIDVHVLLATGYAIFLALVAAVLELVARHSHRRTQAIRTVGFSYHADLDAWKCPNGRHLYRDPAADPGLRRYRAHPDYCNQCAVKDRCTDSDDGRVIEVQPDSWLQSELRKFHRGLSLALLLLAALLLAVMLVRHNSLQDQLLLGFPLLGITGAGLRLALRFFNISPAEREAVHHRAT